MQFRQIYFLMELEELDADVVKRTSLKFVNYFWNIIYQHLKFLIFPKLFNVSKTTYMLIDTHFHLRKPLKFVETIFFFFLFTTHIFIFHLSMWSHSKTSFFVCVCVCVCVFVLWFDKHPVCLVLLLQGKFSFGAKWSTNIITTLKPFFVMPLCLLFSSVNVGLNSFVVFWT
jgi:hypothetical protein